VGKDPRLLSFPRWFHHLMLNRFLDQDTVLVASQQPYTLQAEAENVIRQREDQEQVLEAEPTNGSPQSVKEEKRTRRGSRQTLYNYQSPTDRTVRLIDSFWDATLSRAPNRVETLLELHRRGELRRLVPDRTEILDRAAQHLAVCADSQDAVRNCRYVTAGGLLLAASWLALRLLVPSAPVSSSSSTFLRVGRRVGRSVALPVLGLLVAWVANAVRTSFFYIYTKAKLHRDLRRIPERIWADPE